MIRELTIDGRRIADDERASSELPQQLRIWLNEWRDNGGNLRIIGATRREIEAAHSVGLLNLRGVKVGPSFWGELRLLFGLSNTDL